MDRQPWPFGGLAIADVVWHPVYGLGSHQPIGEYRPPEYEILFEDNVQRYVHLASLFLPTKAEQDGYWARFHVERET